MTRPSMFRRIYIGLLIAAGILVFGTCTEPFEMESTEYEDILIINASITAESKYHEIYVARSFASGEEQKLISGAEVQVMADNGDSFQFEQITPGTYRSTIPFAPIPGMQYQLNLKDENGESYISAKVRLTEPTTVDQISAKRILNEQGEDGVQISVDGTAAAANSGYFRYEYVETYKIESFYNPQKELVVVSESPPVLELRDKEREERVCYVTQESNSILIAETNNLSENRVVDMQLHFIERKDRRIAIRYSILVKQYALTSSSYEFYRTLKSLSSSSNLFSQAQPGLIVGNIENTGSGNAKVIGLFETVSVASKRIFFNFDEVITDNGIRYLGDCEQTKYHISDSELFERVQSGNYLLSGVDPLDIVSIALKNCVDCTLEGSNMVPEFWIEP